MSMSREEDIASIKQTVAAPARAQQQERPDEFMRLFTPDAVWVTAHGKRLIAPPGAGGPEQTGEKGSGSAISGL
jgi:ketosteroid isomerase-like protein